MKAFCVILFAVLACVLAWTYFNPPVEQYSSFSGKTLKPMPRMWYQQFEAVKRHAPIRQDVGRQMNVFFCCLALAIQTWLVSFGPLRREFLSNDTKMKAGAVQMLLFVLLFTYAAPAFYLLSEVVGMTP